MEIFKDYLERSVRLTDERLEHFESQHPEMVGQLNRISETLKEPDKIIQSKTDKTVSCFIITIKPRQYQKKYSVWLSRHHMMTSHDDNFVITAYYTDTIKWGKVLWEKR